MNKNLSVMGLIVRNKLGKAIVVFLMVAAVGCLVYFLGESFFGKTSDNDYYMTRSSIFIEIHYQVVYGKSNAPGYLKAIGIIGYVALALICLGVFKKKSHEEYSLKRLPVPKSRFFLMDAIVNSALFFTLWACMLVLFFVTATRFYHKAGIMNPVPFLSDSLYWDEFLRGLIPIDGILDWGRLIVLCVCAGICAAAVKYAHFMGKTLFWIPIAGLLAVPCMISFVNDYSRIVYSYKWIFFTILVLFTIIVAVVTAISGSRDETAEDVDDETEPDAKAAE